jgi:hypothetical protein
VPEDLRKLLGNCEKKRRLQTRDPVQAKRRHAEALVEKIADRLKRIADYRRRSVNGFP